MKKTKLWLALGATLFSASFATHSFADNSTTITQSDCPVNGACDLGQLINASSEVSNDGTVEINSGKYTLTGSTSFAKSGLSFIGVGETPIIDGVGQFRLFNNHAPSKIENIGFQNFKAASSEGAVINSSGDMNFVISSARFSNNEARNGGAIYMGGKLAGQINDSSFANNSAQNIGGAMQMESLVGEIRGSNFENNEASGGGAMYMRRLVGEISGSSFTGNKSSYGGAIRIVNDMTGQIIGSSFTRNVAANRAGAIDMFNNMTGQIIGSSFTGNQAGETGGAFYIGLFNGQILGSSFIDNQAGELGGAFFMVLFNGQILNSVFSGNQVLGNQSAILVGGGAMTISLTPSSSKPVNLGGSLFFNNSANGEGGAILLANDFYLTAANVPDLSVSDRMIFAGNTAKREPNAIHFLNYSEGITVSFAADQNKEIDFYDPISSDATRPELRLLRLAFNGIFDDAGVAIGSTKGTILFDGGVDKDGKPLGLRSDIYFANGATLHDGKMILQNGASFGAEDNSGLFTVAPGATLEVVYDKYSPKRKDDMSVWLEGEGIHTKLDDNHWVAVPYSAAIASNFNGDLTIAGKLAFDMPDKHGAHASLLKVNGALTFNTGATIDITGYTPDSDETKKGEEHRLVEANAIQGFEPSMVTILGQKSEDVDYMSAIAKLSDDHKLILISTILSWNHEDANKEARGSFKIPENKQFSLGANLADRHDVNEESNADKWNGTVLIKEGKGRLVYYGDGTFSGGTHVKEGDFVLASAGSLSSDVWVKTGASFTLIGQVRQNEKYGQGEQSGEDEGNVGPLRKTRGASEGASVHLEPNAKLYVMQMETSGGYRASVINGNLNAEHGNLTFVLNGEMRNGAAMLQVNKTANIDGAHIKLGFASKDDDFLYLTQPGEYIDLIKANELTGDFEGEALRVVRGATLEHKFLLSKYEGNTLRATLTEEKATDEASSLPAGWLGGLAMLQTGSDAAAAAIADARAVSQSGEGVVPFGKVSGGKSEFGIGDGVNLRHFNYLAGLAYGKNFAPGAMTVGMFFEHGQGNFDTSNVYGEAGTVRGDGKVHYEGGGVMARFEFPSPGGRGLG
jgi:predicted outer membrane repeat protein